MSKDGASHPHELAFLILFGAVCTLCKLAAGFKLDHSETLTFFPQRAILVSL